LFPEEYTDFYCILSFFERAKSVIFDPRNSTKQHTNTAKDKEINSEICINKLIKHLKADDKHYKKHNRGGGHGRDAEEKNRGDEKGARGRGKQRGGGGAGRRQCGSQEGGGLGGWREKKGRRRSRRGRKTG